LYSGKFLYEERKKGPVKGQISLHRGTVGEPGGVPSTGTFETKRKCISGFLFFDPEDIKS
jgi:hypothetical protein